MKTKIAPVQVHLTITQREFEIILEAISAFQLEQWQTLNQLSATRQHVIEQAQAILLPPVEVES